MIRIRTPEDLGRALAALRESVGATRVAVGQELGTTGQRIGAYERAAINPSARTLLDHLAVLGHELAIIPRQPEGQP